VAYQWFVWIGKPWNGASLTILCLPRWWQNCPSSPPFLRIQRTANGVTPKLSLIRQLGRRDKEKTREKAEARSRIGTEWEGKYACRGERARIYSIRVHMLLHFWAQGFYLFLRWLIRRSRTTRPRKTSFTSWNATCDDNSIVHFIRSAALRYKHAYPLSWSNAGIKLATAGERGRERE